MRWRNCRPSTSLRSVVDLDHLQYPIVQLSLDLISLDEALETAAVGVAAGVDWLEAGTPLLLAEGLRAVEALRSRFPEHPIVADLKTMDGGYLEAEMMAKAGANLVVVMGRAHEATIRRVVDAGRDFGVKVMGDNLAADDRVECAKWMEGLGVDFVIHHIGYDERNMIRGISPLDELSAVVRAVSVPVQAVGGLSIQQAIECPARGAPLVVIGAPLVIDGAAFRPASTDLFPVLKKICEDVHQNVVRYPLSVVREARRTTNNE
jgi:3-hexulose-6-phosphate synthase